MIIFSLNKNQIFLFSIFILSNKIENSETLCKNDCEDRIASNKRDVERIENGQREKKKYLVDGMFKNEQVN
jgi:hypothetical protein